jgi:hypothetical protein
MNGDAVFKIVAEATNPYQLGVAHTYEDYQKLLNKHLYLPIIHLAPIHIQLAYLYGCLNMVYDTPRQHSFVFMYRLITKNGNKDTRWHPWFIVNPYKDSDINVVHALTKE